MQRIIRFSSLFILAILLMASVAIAQTTSGSIAGIVTDQNQAAIANATVKITEVSRSFTLSATASADGHFVFPEVPPGTYTMEVEANGFKKLERTGLNLVANDKLSLGDIAMQVGGSNETVTITSEATLLQAESAERSYAVQGEAVRNIAVNGRNFLSLSNIAQGLAPVGTDNGDAMVNDITQISANGLRPSANNLQLDGVAVVDTGNNGQLTQINLEAVSEFKVLTSDYQAEYGRSAGAQISAVTRSGTKDFHGSFYIYKRGDELDANTWLNNHSPSQDAAGNERNFTPRPQQNQRNIGYTIGGPVYIPKVFNKKKDKLFFFFNQEYTTQVTPPTAPTHVTVPTALERQGDFSKSVDSAGNPFPYIKDTSTGQPCNPPMKDSKTGITIPAITTGCFQDSGVLGKIPAAALNPIGLAILKSYPLPNTSGTGFNYTSQVSTSNPQRQDLIRIDYNISDKWRMSGKFLYYKNTSDLPYGSFVLGSNLPTFGADFPNNRYSISTTVTGTLNPTTVLEVTLGLSHNFINIVPDNPNYNKTDLGLSNFPLLYPSAVQNDLPPQFGFGGTRIANSPNIGSNDAPFTNFNRTHDLSISVSKIWGSHNTKFGVFWQDSFKPQSSFAANNGNIDFGDNSLNPLDTGFGFANAAVGVFNSFTQASVYAIGQYRYNNIEWYAQDNWKVSSRLTLDYGIRFYLVNPQYDQSSQTSNFLPDQYNPAAAPLLFQPGLDASGNRIAINPVTGATMPGTDIGLVVPGTGNQSNGVPINGVFQAGQGISQGLYENRGVQFGPRLGFAYDVFGNQKMVVRGGAGVFYDRPQGNVVFNLVENPPTTVQQTLVFGTLNSVGTGQALVSPPSLSAIDQLGKIPTTYAYNLGIQYKLPYDTVFDISYVGTSSEHLLQQRSINAPAYGTAYLPQNQDPTATTSGAPGANALPVNFLRPFQGYGSIAYIEPAASSNYNSLQTSLNRRFSRGLLLGVNYTWSKALGTESNDTSTTNGFGAPNNADNRRANYGPLDFDIRNNFSFNFVYEVPKFNMNKSNFAGKLGDYAINNWQLSGVYHYVSGQPYNISYSVPGLSPYTLTGTQDVEGARIVLTGNPGSGHSGNPYQEFNPAAFAIPSATGSMSFESGRNFLYLPPINSVDLSLAKRISIKEKVTMEIRIDAFNALNHTQFNGISTTFNGALGATTPTNLADEFTNPFGFGAVNSVRPPRQLQLSGRIQF